MSRRAALPLILLVMCVLATSAQAPPSLTVQRAGPAGELANLEQVNEIRIVFSEPMVTLGRIPQPVGPPAGATYMIDPTLRPEFQTLSLRAIAATGRVQWAVDRRPVGSGSGDATVAWPLERGTHVVRARDGRGHVAETTIAVK